MYTQTHFSPIQYSAQIQLVVVFVCFGIFIVDVVFLSFLCFVFYPYIISENQILISVQNKTGQDRLGHIRIGQDILGQVRTAQDRKGEDKTGQDRSVSTMTTRK